MTMPKLSADASKQISRFYEVLKWARDWAKHRANGETRGDWGSLYVGLNTVLYTIEQDSFASYEPDWKEKYMEEARLKHNAEKRLRAVLDAVREANKKAKDGEWL